MIEIAASDAVSVRSILGPKEIPINPNSLADWISFLLKPPSGPINKLIPFFGFSVFSKVLLDSG